MTKKTEGSRCASAFFISICQSGIAICRGFGMHVLTYDLNPADDGLEYVSLGELFCRSDVISLHCPLTEGTRHLIDAEALPEGDQGPENRRRRSRHLRGRSVRFL